MGNIIQFPDSRDKHQSEHIFSDQAQEGAEKPSTTPRSKILMEGIIRFVWYATVLCWPLIKWFIALGVVWHTLKILYFWDTPGRHEGWVLFGWFFALTALTYFVSYYKS